MQDLEKLALTQRPDGVAIPVKAVPGSARDRIAGVLGESLKIAVAAAPEKGRANQALARVLAQALGVPARTVRLLSGPTNPRKEFLIAGISPAQIRQRLADL